MRTTNVIILGSVWDMLPKLTDGQISDLFRGIADWRLGNEPVFNDPVVQGIWFATEYHLIESVKKYQQQVEKNRQNGAKGGRPKKTQENPNNPSGYLETQPNPQKHKDKDMNKDKDKTRHKNNDNEELDMFSPLAQKLAERYLK